jgi:hypothetical protein
MKLWDRKTLWQRLRDRWPLVWKSTMRRQFASQEAGWKHLLDRKRAENEEERKALDGIVRRLVKISVDPLPRVPNTFQLRICFRDELVHRGFVHGDNREVDYLIESMARELRHELRSINFARFKDYPEPARRPTSWTQPEAEGPHA